MEDRNIGIISKAEIDRIITSTRRFKPIYSALMTYFFFFSVGVIIARHVFGLPSIHSPAYGVMGILLIPAIMIIFKERPFDWFEKPFVDFTITCPHCKSLINIGRDWFCGNCSAKNTHLELLANYSTALHGCKAAGCSQREQAALNCPDCGKPIIINWKRFQQQNRDIYARLVREKQLEKVTQDTENTGPYDDI